MRLAPPALPYDAVSWNRNPRNLAGGVARVGVTRCGNSRVSPPQKNDLITLLVSGTVTQTSCVRTPHCGIPPVWGEHPFLAVLCEV